MRAPARARDALSKEGKESVYASAAPLVIFSFSALADLSLGLAASRVLSLEQTGVS